MRSPDDFYEWARKKYQRLNRTWLALPDFGENCEFILTLHPPTETEASKSMDTVTQWISQWRNVDLPQNCSLDIEWKMVAWRVLGTQQLPNRVRVKGASSLATLAKSVSDWEHITRSANILRQAWPDHDLNGVLPKLTAELAKIEKDDTYRLIDVVNWLIENPASGMLPRQLPIQGIDSKWLERRRSAVEKLKATLSSNPELGLASSPTHFSIRVLADFLLGGRDDELHSFSAPISELARLTWEPSWVLIVENYQTLCALPSLPGMVAVFGKGKDAPALADVPWIYKAPHLLYWGDLDTHGMHILSLTRKVLPQIESVLMDETTLTCFADMAVIEPKPFAGNIGHLTEAELKALARLRKNNTRLEQERIDMPYAQMVIEQHMEKIPKETQSIFLTKSSSGYMVDQNLGA